jgi:hypothetical protein
VALGYVVKPQAGSELLPAVEAAIRGVSLSAPNWWVGLSLTRRMTGFAALIGLAKSYHFCQG